MQYPRQKVVLPAFSKSCPWPWVTPTVKIYKQIIEEDLLILLSGPDRESKDTGQIAQRSFANKI